MTTPTAPGARTLADFAGTIVLVGAGKMGGAMLDGWLALGLPAASVVVIEPQPTPELTALISRGLKLNPPPTAVRDTSAIVIAIKPQVAPTVVPTLVPLLAPDTVVLSIMAGRTLAFLESALAPNTALVRAASRSRLQTQRSRSASASSCTHCWRQPAWSNG
jgi:pyrroline-5-carboxylate reductase